MENEDIFINDIKSLVDVVLKVNTAFEGQVWWRGQGCSRWKLTPAAYRQDNGYEYERNEYFRFKQRAPSRNPTTPNEGDILSWLFLMQHHGLPTRLLDWTESPLFACYFAVEDGKLKNDNGALYALCPYKLNLQQIGINGVLSPYHEKISIALFNDYEKEIENDKHILGIMPAETDIRVIAQLSVFTLHGSGLSLDDLPETGSFVFKFIIPEKSKKELEKGLKFLGVRKSNLFPDLDHLAEELRELRFNPPSSESEPRIFGGSQQIFGCQDEYGSST